MHNYHIEMTVDNKEDNPMGIDEWMFDRVEEKKDEIEDSDPFEALKLEESEEESVPSE